MSALIYFMQPDTCVLAMDTLAGLMSRGDQPYRRQNTSKFLVLPHLQMVICCTGIGNIAWRWGQALLEYGLHGSEIAEVNCYVPEVLRRIAAADDHDFKKPGQTLTVYHFGYSPSAGRVLGYAYLSPNDFASEPLQDGMHWKPQDDEVNHLCQAEAEALMRGKRDVTDLCVNVISVMRANDEARSPEERLNIGGDIHLVVGGRDEIRMLRIHRFPDAGEPEDQPAAPLEGCQ